MNWFFADGARAQGFLFSASVENLSDQVFAPNVWDAFHLFAAASVQQRRMYPTEEVGGEHLRDALNLVARDGQPFHGGEWSNLLSALRTNTNIDYDGAAGPNDFDALGQAIGPYEVWCIAGGPTFTQEAFLDGKAVQALKP